MGFSSRGMAQQIGSDAEDVAPTIGTAPSSSPNSTGTATPPAAPVPVPPPLPAVPAPIGMPLSASVPYGAAASETGQSLADSIQRDNANQPYNLRAGPVALRADFNQAITLNDNIALTKNDRITDVILTPFVTVHGRWEVSDLNTLTFNIGLGYQCYVLDSQYNSILLAPDSEANFNFFVGEVAINLHDAFSYEQDPTQVGQLSGQARLKRFSNDAGISATWDLNDIIVEAAYDHTNLWVTDSIYDYLTNQSDIFAPKVTFKLNESIQAGLSASVSDTRYEQSFQNDNTSEQMGPFVDATLSSNLSVHAAAGGFLSQYDTGGGNGDNSNISSFYANCAINHRINQAISESLTAGREYLPGLTSNYTDRIYVTYGDQWTATKTIGVGASLFWENLDDSNGAFRANSNRYGFNLNLSDSLSSQLNVNVGYQFLLKESDPSYLSYYQNQGTVGMQYNF